MKKTLIALMALAGVATAETYKLNLTSVTFNTESILTYGNQAMNWEPNAAYETWYMEFTLPTVTSDVYQATITTGPAGSNSSGLSVSAKNGSITLGTGMKNVITDAGSLTFSSTDTLTFAYYDGTAYLGNMTTQEFISVSTNLPSPTTMTSGISRAWANGNPTGTTQIGATSIASLDGLNIPDGSALDMGTLMTTGVAQTMQLVPEPATATLSLLALAGLAARRRRK